MQYAQQQDFLCIGVYSWCTSTRVRVRVCISDCNCMRYTFVNGLDKCYKEIKTLHEIINGGKLLQIFQRIYFIYLLFLLCMQIITTILNDLLFNL